MIMDLVPADSRNMTSDQFWDWGPTMHYAVEQARLTGIRRRVYGISTSKGWHYRIVATGKEKKR